MVLRRKYEILSSNLNNNLSNFSNKFLRKNDIKYKELNLDEFNGTELELFEIIIQNPRILERPIIVSEEQAVIGRPPENILQLL